MRPARPRTFLRFFLPGAIRHARRVSPSLRFARRHGVISRVDLRGERWISTANVSVDGIERPDSLTIVGSGPSIATMDLSVLPAGGTMLLNGAISLMPEVQPFCVVIEDRRFVDRHWAMLRPVLDARPRMIASPEVLSAIAERDPEALRSDVLVNDSLYKPVGKRRRRGGRLDFAETPEIGTIRGGSVAVTAFQWAVALRPRRIAFAGVELWNANAPRFYEGESMAKSGIVGAQRRILHAIGAGTAIARREGIEVVNLSPNSALGTIGIPTVALDRVERTDHRAA